jgi:hypothetical protein
MVVADKLHLFHYGLLLQSLFLVIYPISKIADSLMAPFRPLFLTVMHYRSPGTSCSCRLAACQ